MIHHTVFFKLNFPAGSTEEVLFFEASGALSTIEGVQEFHTLKEISPKNHYEYGFAMKFADNEVYDRYNKHPLHVQFVNHHWITSVADFIEIDYEVLGK
jgi:hypothetical protein